MYINITFDQIFSEANSALTHFGPHLDFEVAEVGIPTVALPKDSFLNQN